VKRKKTRIDEPRQVIQSHHQHLLQLQLQHQQQQQGSDNDNEDMTNHVTSPVSSLTSSSTLLRRSTPLPSPVSSTDSPRPYSPILKSSSLMLPTPSSSRTPSSPRHFSAPSTPTSTSYFPAMPSSPRHFPPPSSSSSSTFSWTFLLLLFMIFFSIIFCTTTAIILIFLPSDGTLVAENPFSSVFKTSDTFSPTSAPTLYSTPSFPATSFLQSIPSLFSAFFASFFSSSTQQQEKSHLILIHNQQKSSTISLLSSLNLMEAREEVLVKKGNDDLINGRSPNLTQLLHAYLNRFSIPIYKPRGDYGGCKEISENLYIQNTQKEIAHGTVKNIYIGRWGLYKERVAVLKLRDNKYNGDFSSGISRLRKLQGHPNVVDIVAVCPFWDGFVPYPKGGEGGGDYERIYNQITNDGYAEFFNHLIVKFYENGDLDKIDSMLESKKYSNNWKQRLKIAIDYARLVTFLHNTGPEKNPFFKPLIQKDRKINQFLVDSDLRLRLNDAEAMPIIEYDADENNYHDPTRAQIENSPEVIEDTQFMTIVLKKIFGKVNLPNHLSKRLAEIYMNSEKMDLSQSANKIIHHNVTSAHILTELILSVEF